MWTLNPLRWTLCVQLILLSINLHQCLPNDFTTTTESSSSIQIDTTTKPIELTLNESTAATTIVPESSTTFVIDETNDISVMKPTTTESTVDSTTQDVNSIESTSMNPISVDFITTGMSDFTLKSIEEMTTNFFESTESGTTESSSMKYGTTKPSSMESVTTVSSSMESGITKSSSTVSGSAKSNSMESVATESNSMASGMTESSLMESSSTEFSSTESSMIGHDQLSQSPTRTTKSSEIDTTTIKSINSMTSEKLMHISTIDDDDDDELENNEDEYGKPEPKTNKNEANKVEPKSKTEPANDDLDDDDDDDDDQESITNDDTCEKMSSFVREYNFSSFLPDDFEQVYETLNDPQIDIYNQIHHINDTLDVFGRLGKYMDKLQNNRDMLETVTYLFSLMMDKLYEAKLEPQCQADLLQVANAIRRRELWAMRFPDSFGNLPSGILKGAVGSFGEYDQCISIKSPITQNLDRHIYGKYCQVQLRLFTPKIDDYDPSFETIFRAHPAWQQVLQLANTLGAQNFLGNETKVVAMLSEGLNALSNNMFYYGSCFPSSCSAGDIERMINRFIYPILKTPVSVLPKLCDTHPEIAVKVLDNYQWTAIICISTLSIIVVVCSIYHLYLNNFVDDFKDISNTSNDLNNNNQSNSKQIYFIGNVEAIFTTPKPPARSIAQQFVLAFSAFQNTDYLMKVDARFGVVDTIRLVLTFFVYSLQAFDFTFFMTTQMIRDIFWAGPGEIPSSNAYWFARLPGIWIDGFMFTLGMMLIGTQFSRLKRSNGQFDYLLYVWKRWYRLSFAMIGTFFALYLLPLTGNGPLWYIHDQWMLPACKEPSSIISSFLYYSNTNAMRTGYKVQGTFPLCNVPTWFLSMSTQLYLVAPLVFLPLYFKPRTGITITVAIILLSPISTIAPYLFFHLPPYISITNFESAQHGLRAFVHYHTYPFQYVTALHIGFLTGYAIKRHPTAQFIGGRVTELALWIVSFPMIVAIFVWHNSFWELGQVNTLTNTLAWFVCSKFMLPGALGYICYMCCTGRAKTMNRILTFRTLQPLAKLSYGIYLLRIPTIFYRITSPKHTYEIKYFQLWQNVFIDFLITAIMAYFLYLLFEAPAANIMRIFEQNDNLLSKRKDNNKRNKEIAEEEGQIQIETKQFSSIRVSGP